MGIGDWVLGFGDWGLGIGPNPQSPIPNPQSPIPIEIDNMDIIRILNLYVKIIKKYQSLYFIKNHEYNYLFLF